MRYHTGKLDCEEWWKYCGKTVNLDAMIDLEPFNISFKGIIVSNDAILAKGYYHEGLLKLRDKIRKIATERGFDLKERYQSISAHATIERFMTNVSNSEQLLARVQNYHDFEIGTIRVNELELVIHDWYHSQKEEIRKFILRTR
jgi:2'-5' RNA ligase